jgi:hypothetical protein
MERFLELCKKLSVLTWSITFNEHETMYEKIKDLSPDIKDSCVDYDECVKNNSLYEVHLYPTTPVGFYNVYASRLELALDKMNELLEETLIGR